ncbi:cache domain-containing protein [Halobacteriovorax sp. HLS]|uniref:cache domain-containing protein n=1 Tax=Halobacteriovorax sp. HLS TaxID=2234000 RepID=UPI000FD9FB0F|nr:cache domain-containing protein [Halobacteriovorax sp. HLS]
MKKLSLLAVGVFSLCMSNTFAADCSKEQAKESVEKMCDLIKAKGKGALGEIGKYRYCGSNYVWIQDSDVKMVLHPIKRRLNGKDLKGSKDENGVPLFVEFDKKAKADAAGGWVDYVWAKPGAEKATPKVSYVKKCEGGLNWIAGSGIWK